MVDESLHAIAARALHGTGLNVIGSAPIEAYDARAPLPQRSRVLMRAARGVLVVGSGGRELWDDFRRAVAADPSHLDRAHPLDDHVASALDGVDVALGLAGVGSRRFEPTLLASPALDFRALGEIAALGSLGPFGMLIHETHGPWWALRGAWLVDAAVDPPPARATPCSGCLAPCVGGPSSKSRAIELATREARVRCIVGHASRYEDEQLAYHYDRQATLAKIRTS